MKTTVTVKIAMAIRDAKTGREIKRRPAKMNMVFDSALTALATGLHFDGIFSCCKIGSSNAPNSTPGGATTFTQAGATITASGAFFTGAMVGSIFKYGVGSAGAEQYIASVAGGGLTAQVVGAGMNVLTPTPATVWYVQQTALTTPLTALTGGCHSVDYVTSPGACGTTFPGGPTSNSISLTRTYKFPVQAAPYTVQEIGYSDNQNNDGTCNGRFVLAGGGDTITPSQFYVVQISITFALSPDSPTAIPNVGTGIDTSGDIMLQRWDCHVVNSLGTGGDYQGSWPGDLMDSTPPTLYFAASTITLNANIKQEQDIPGAYLYAAGPSAWSNSGLPVGVARCTYTWSLNTAGETVECLYWGRTNSARLVLNLTNPFVLPSGPFTGNLVLQRTVTRTLTN